MEKSIYNYTEEEKLLLKRNTRQSVNIIMLGYIVCYAILLVAGAILSIASRAMNTTVGVAFAGVIILVMYAVMLMRAAFTMLGVNSFRRENRFFGFASVFSVITVITTALTAIMVWLYLNSYSNAQMTAEGIVFRQSDRSGLIAGFSIIAINSIIAALIPVMSAAGYQRTIAEAGKAYLSNPVRRLAVLYIIKASLTLLAWLIIPYDFTGLIIYCVLDYILEILGIVMLVRLTKEAGQPDVPIFCLTVKGKDAALGAGLFIAAFGIVMLFVKDFFA